MRRTVLALRSAHSPALPSIASGQAARRGVPLRWVTDSRRRERQPVTGLNRSREQAHVGLGHGLDGAYQAGVLPALQLVPEGAQLPGRDAHLSREIPLAQAPRSARVLREPAQAAGEGARHENRGRAVVEGPAKLLECSCRAAEDRRVSDGEALHLRRDAYRCRQVAVRDTRQRSYPRPPVHPLVVGLVVVALGSAPLVTPFAGPPAPPTGATSLAPAPSPARRGWTGARWWR